MAFDENTANLLVAPSRALFLGIIKWCEEAPSARGTITIHTSLYRRLERLCPPVWHCLAEKPGAERCELVAARLVVLLRATLADLDALWAPGEPASRPRAASDHTARDDAQEMQRVSV